MTFKLFAELVELKAKTASVFPFVLGVAYALFHYQHVHWLYMLWFFIAMLLFNMAVDILDNYMDYHNATDAHDYKVSTNIIGRENLSLALVKRMMLGMIFLSALIGIVLAYKTSWVILLLGTISYAVGIFYSAGPKPLSSLPIGEVASGLAMGFIIPLICVYLNIYDVQPFDVSFFFKVFFISIPSMFAIANLMLANNTCDLEEDVLNNRHTLVYYIKKPRALKLFVFLAIAPFVTATLSVLTGLVPVSVLGMWLAFPKVLHNTKRFLKRQDKRQDFSLAIQNLALTVMMYAVLFIIGALI